MHRLLLLVMVGFLGGCWPPKPPGPTPQPTPVPTPVPAPSPICEIDQVCGCWHQPPGQDWQKLPDCPTPTPGPTPTPVPVGCTLGGAPTTPAPDQANTLGDRVNLAMKTLMPNCQVGGTCLLGNITQQGWQRVVNEELRRQGLCAGQHTPATDEIAVAAQAKDNWQGFHIFAGDTSNGPVPPGGARRTVLWSPQAYRGAWIPPDVTPTPPPTTTGCTDPVTPKVDKWNLKPHNKWIDATPQFYNRETERWDGTTITGYCDAAKFVDRLHCPARSECPGYKCEEREACEQIGIGGKPHSKPLWRCEQGTAEVNPENPLQAACAGGGWIEVCRSDGTGCTRLAL